MNIEKYCKVLDIKDFNNMSPEESQKWQKLMSLSLAARGNVCRAKEQGYDILDCLSKNALLLRYKSQLNILAIAKHYNIQPLQIKVGSKTILYFSKEDVATLDEIMKKDKKEIKEIVFKQNCLDKYGVESYKQLDWYKAKVAASVKKVWQSEGYRENVSTKVKNTYANKSNEEVQLKKQHISEALKVPNRKKAEIIENYRKDFEKVNNEKLLKLTEVAKLLDIKGASLKGLEQKLKIKFKVCKIYNVKFLKESDVKAIQTFLNELPSNRSILENQVLSYVRSICTRIKGNDRRALGNGKELDIYIPNKKVAIEVDGIYWHSDAPGLKKDEIPSEVVRNFTANRSLEKTKLCEKKGIKLLHIFEDDWLLKPDIAKAYIKSTLGCFDNEISADLCNLRKLSIREYKRFLNKNHLQGYQSAQTRLGLFHKDVLVACIGLNDNKLVRFCTKQNTKVSDALPKLLKVTELSEIRTTVDRMLTDFFTAASFKIEKTNDPEYYYVKNGRRFSKHCFSKQKIENLYNQGKLEYWDPEESEEINMYKNNFIRIWDCGSVNLVWRRNED